MADEFMRAFETSVFRKPELDTTLKLALSTSIHHHGTFKNFPVDTPIGLLLSQSKQEGGLLHGTSSIRGCSS